MKKTILSLAVVLGAGSAFAQNPYVDGLTQDYNSIAFSNSVVSQSPGAYDQYDVVMNWCDSAAQRLEDGIHRFGAILNNGGSNLQAFRSLQATLMSVATSQQFSRGNEPLIKMGADTILTVSGRLEQLGLASDIGTLNAMEQLTRNLTRAAYRFDKDYYVPYMYKHRRNCYTCRNGFVEEMQRDALKFAAMQVNAVTNGLTAYVNQEYRPIGRPQIYLNAAEIVSTITAADLSYNIFASQIPCTISTLRNIGANLASFNMGNQSFYGNVRAAVHQSAWHMKQAANDIRNMNSCRRGYYR